MVKEMQEGYLNKLKNKLFGCLCEREKNAEWEAFLDSILVELQGIPESSRSIDFYVIYYKLNSCRYLSYKFFRKTIFDVMNILDNMFSDRRD